jgi:hypothetical protein
MTYVTSPQRDEYLTPKWAHGMRKTNAAGPSGPPLRLSRREVFIRTLSVSLVAVAAIAASVLLTRNREEREGLLPSGSDQAPRLQLDAIRAAGL